MNLDEYRNNIDKIDNDILNLFIKRMQLCTDIAEYKKSHNLPILNSEIEISIINNRLSNSPNNIHEYVKAFFSNILEISKCHQLTYIENKKKFDYIEKNDILMDNDNILVVCQGTKGAYQHTASKNLFPNSKITFCNTFKEVFDTISDKKADFAVVPLENSTAGSVTDVYDLLSQYDLYINSMYKLKIDHCLAVKEQTNFDNLIGIYSHIQALSQCSNYLSQLDRKISINQYDNTALASEFVANYDKHIGAICSKDCAKLYGLKILKENIQNNTENYTKFIVVSNTLNSSKNCDEVCICVQIPHSYGQLNKMLTKFSLYGINMTKISSRPVGDKHFNVVFFINFEGNLTEKKTQNLLQDLYYNYDFVKVLGSYKATI